MKQTSVDWLIEQLTSGHYYVEPHEAIIPLAELKALQEKARAMHREEVVEAYKAEMEVDDVLAVVYYNNTFNEK